MSSAANATSTDVDDSGIRQSWKVGSHTQIYSNSRKKWFVGEVAQIFHDAEGEWLEVRYDKSMSKQVQRYSTDIKPTEEQLAELKKHKEKAQTKTAADMPFGQREMDVRQSWDKGDQVEIFSNTHQEWYLGEIVDVIKDDEGEWLNCVWHRANGEAMSKQVQRFSTDVRPAQTDDSDSSEENGATNNNSALSLSDQIANRNKNFRRRAPLFSRTLRASTFTFPATSAVRRSRKLNDIKETDEAASKAVNVDAWRPPQVADWISSLGKAYEKYKPKFKGVRGTDLLEMDEANLEAKGIPKLHRYKMYLSLQVLQENNILEESMSMEPLSWDPKKVRRWAFKQPILNQYATKFEQHGVDGILLLHLDLDDVTTIGVRPYHRERVLQTIQSFAKESFPEDESAIRLLETESKEEQEEDDDNVGDLPPLNNRMKQHRRRDSVQHDLTRLSHLANIGGAITANDDPSVVEVISDMASLLTQIAALFSIPQIRENAQTVQSKVDKLLEQIGEDVEEEDERSANSSPQMQPSSKKKIQEANLETQNDNAIPFAQNWINSQQGKKGHRRRGSLPMNSTNPIEETEEDEDVSDMEEE